jgi:dihydrolipoamide dehydrogenase
MHAIREEDMLQKLVWLPKPSSTVAAADHSLEEKDLVVIGGGVAGYVAAIKAGQAGLKVC